MNAVITDDHSLAITAIRNLLIKNGIEILAELTEGGNAVQWMETFRPDVVVTDVNIPGASGTQVLETLRRHQCSGTVIIVSARNDHLYGKHCADAGVNGFVSKKGDMNNIIATTEAAENDYCYLLFSLNRSIGSLTSDQQELDSLSGRKISVMRHTFDGKDNNDTVERMFVSNKTVSAYESRLMEKLECKSLMNLYVFT